MTHFHPSLDQHNSASGSADSIEYRVDFGPSIIRLRLREWLTVGLIVAACFIAAPRLWERFERLPQLPDGRVSYEASEDYWTYRSRMRNIVESERIPILGDSVIWGEYVSAAETLSAFLNAESDSRRFANAGVNGAHPLALSGLVDNYTGDLNNRWVILHCNLLWMSSPERDLQSDNDVPINHARLIPQFSARIASYKAPFSKRLGIVIDRSVPFFDWVSHVRSRYFEGQDLQSWSIANPYSNPLAQFRREFPEDASEARHAPVPWTAQGIEPQEMPWVELRSSLQWEAWRRTALDLHSNGTHLLVVVGPLNEHLLTDSSRLQYQSRQQEVEAWLDEQGIPFVAPAVLPSNEYGDASHPLSGGYARLARSISSEAAFRKWLGD
jgi:hypothetical protein